ncbi:MAG TPA: tail fiber domain-containing protein [Pyrinomonadaceae bacterium]|nr:tail fiber domain-containing protein [Pyrinomonadaceae bacterium]
MLKRLHLLSAIISLALLNTYALAQTPQAPPPVTAAAAEAGARFAAPEGVSQVRLEIYAQSGERVFDSGMRVGSILDWKAADVQQGMADGSYLLVVTVKDLRGKLSQRTGALSLQAGRVSLARAATPSAAQAKSLAAERQSQKIEQAAGADDSLTVVTEKERAITISAHDGRDGQVTSTSGALTFRTGDTLTGADREQMRVTPEGRVGIGTTDPQAALDVAGTIRARGGIQFEDGTVLTSAGALKGSRSATAAFVGTNESGTYASGIGTANRLSKWLDGAGTLGDSAIAESNGNVGIGTSGPDQRLGVQGMLGFYPQAWVQPTTRGMFMGHFGTVASIYAFNYPAGSGDPISMTGSTLDFGVYPNGGGGSRTPGLMVANDGKVGVGTTAPTQKLEVAGNVKVSGAGNGVIFADGTKQTTAGGAMTGTAVVSAINDAATAGVIGEARLSPNVAKLNAQNAWTGQNTFVNGLSSNGVAITNVGNPVSATDATNKAYTDANFVKFVPGAEQLSVGDANGTAPMINLRGGSTCCSGPGGHTPAWFKVFQNGSFVATGNLGIGVSPMQGKGYRTSWDSYKGAFRSGYADAEWDDANVGFFSWAGGSNSTAIGLYALAFGDTNSAESTSSIVFGSGNQVKGAAGFSAGAGNRVCDTYGVALGNNAKSGGPLINGKCDPDSFNIHGLAAVAIGYNVTADQDHTTAMGKFASNNGFTGTFIWSDGSATASADTFRNTANNEFAIRATGGVRLRTNLAGTTGCNLPAGSGVFNCTSTRTTKENFTGVDGNDVLASLRKVPVSTWNYIAEGQQSRHLGPMAEDFYGAFKLGTSDKTIGIQDAVGVSLAAVKALDARTLELQQKTEEVEQLRSKVNTLEQRLAALEALIQKQAEGQQK